MLPKDARRRRDGAVADEQTRLDSHLKEKPLKERVAPYSDKIFHSAAIEWLVSTDQVSVSCVVYDRMVASNTLRTRP